MERLIGIVLYTSVVKVPGLRKYFSGPTAQESVTRAMGVGRFETLLQHIHLSNNLMQPARGDEGYDKLFKVYEKDLGPCFKQRQKRLHNSTR